MSKIKWISIKDELPPVGKQVLTYGGWGIRMDEYDHTQENGEIRFWGDDENYNTELKVTHWSNVNLPK